MWRSVSVLAAVVLLSVPAARAGDDLPGVDLPLLGKAGDFSLAPPTVAEDAASGWYVRADVGYVNSRVTEPGIPGLLNGADFGGFGWSLGVGLGYQLLPWLRAEVSVETFDFGQADTLLGRYDANATVAMASLYWDVVTVAGFTPYVSGGVGFAIDHLAAPPAVGTGGNAWELAWSVGAGVSYALDPAWSVDIGYRYLDLGGPSYAGLPGGGLDSLTAHQVRIGVRYSFGH